LFSSLIMSSCYVHGRKRPVWSCGVVDWISRPLISPTPSLSHRQVTEQEQHMRRKSEDGVGDYDDAFSPVPAASRFRTILIHNKTCSWTTSMVLRPLFRENYCPETVTMARCTFFHLQDMIEVLSTCIASLSHFTACPLQPELATPP